MPEPRLAFPRIRHGSSSDPSHADWVELIPITLEHPGRSTLLSELADHSRCYSFDKYIPPPSNRPQASLGRVSVLAGNRQCMYSIAYLYSGYTSHNAHLTHLTVILTGKTRAVITT